MARVTLAIIAKDEVDRLNNIINSYAEYFDEVAIAYDDDIVKDKIVENSKVKLYKYDWINDFAHKRNFLAEKITTEWYFRLDTDDKIDHPELLKSLFQKAFQEDLTCVHLMYYYNFDESGNCTAKHWRETLIKNDGNLYWNKKIHENLLPKDSSKLVPGRDVRIGILHDCTPEEQEESAKRNLELLEKEYEDTKDKPDPRTVGYLARMYYGLKKYDKAIPLFEKFLSTSGWDDDKYFAWCQLALCFDAVADGDSKSSLLESAITCLNEAMLLNPFFPDAYFHLMSIYYDKGNYKKAIEWGKIGFEKNTPDTGLVIDPSQYTWRPLCVMAMCYLKSGNLKEAKKLFEKAYSIAPHDKECKNFLNFTIEICRDNDMVVNYLQLMNYLKGDIRCVEKLVESIPKKLATDERIISAKNMIMPPKKWGDDTIVFFCGNAWEDWVDTSVIGGIGGSEEATIYLSRELTKLGYKVTIFNRCGELGGDYKGVTYKNYYEFNPRDSFNTVIFWRSIPFKQPITAKKKIVWMHDVPQPGMFDGKDYDKVIVLSQFHKSLLSGVPEDKIYVSRNGINISDFTNLSESRDNKTIIYTSSYDRGLEHLLDMWPRIIKEVPEAKLNIFYGWKTYDEMIKAGTRDSGFKDMMVKKMNQTGITERGRIGHKKLAKEIAKSGIWAYPSHFQEISCISAMKAQVGGAIPVVNDYAALTETVKFGIKNNGDINENSTYKDYTSKLISLLKDDSWQDNIRTEMMDKCKDIFSWESVAKEWVRDIL